MTPFLTRNDSFEPEDCMRTFSQCVATRLLSSLQVNKVPASLSGGAASILLLHVFYTYLRVNIRLCARAAAQRAYAALCPK